MVHRCQCKFFQRSILISRLRYGRISLKVTDEAKVRTNCASSFASWMPKLNAKCQNKIHWIFVSILISPQWKENKRYMFSCDWFHRLADWIAKKADREREKEERRQAKLEKLRSEPKHYFVDPKYDKQKSKVAESLDEAITQGISSSQPWLQYVF